MFPTNIGATLATENKNVYVGTEIDGEPLFASAPLSDEYAWLAAFPDPDSKNDYCGYVLGDRFVNAPDVQAFKDAAGDRLVQQSFLDTDLNNPLWYTDTNKPSNHPLDIPLNPVDDNTIEYESTIDKTLFGLYQWVGDAHAPIPRAGYASSDNAPHRIYSVRGHSLEGREAFGLNFLSHQYNDPMTLIDSYNTFMTQSMLDNRKTDPLFGNLGFYPQGDLCTSSLGTLVVTKSTIRERGPQPYTAVRILDNLQPAFLVKPQTQGETLHYGKDMTKFMEECGQIFDHNDDIGSFIYTLNYVGGQKVGDILVNRLGMWALSDLTYSVFLDDLKWISTSVSWSPSEWPQLAELNNRYFYNRVADSTLAFSRVNNTYKMTATKQAAYMAASALGGLFSGLADAGGNMWMQNDRQEFSKLMQESSQAFQRRMAAEKLIVGSIASNWLKEQEYDRGISQDAAQYSSQTTRSSDSSATAAAKSGSNPTWEVEQQRKLYNSLRPSEVQGGTRKQQTPVPSHDSATSQDNETEHEEFFDTYDEQQAFFETLNNLQSNSDTINQIIARRPSVRQQDQDSNDRILAKKAYFDDTPTKERRPQPVKTPFNIGSNETQKYPGYTRDYGKNSYATNFKRLV